MAECRGGRERDGFALALWVLVIAIFCVNALRFGGDLIDDAFISLRYAANWVDGHGLVFNPGERVEGYTNFLWVVFGGVFLAIGADPVLGLKAVSVASTVWLLTSIARMLPGARGARGAGGSPLLWLLPLEGFAYWSFTSMETQWFTALLAAGLRRALAERWTGRPNGAVWLFVALALTRPEGVLLFALTAGALVASSALVGSRPPWSLLARNIGVFAASYGAYFAARMAYYGSALPNTFYAKVTGGSEQLASGLAAGAGWLAYQPLFGLALLLPLVALHPARGARLPWRADALAVAAVGLGFAGYAVTIGGDFMPFHRFFLPVWPLCAVLLSACWPLLGTVGRGGPGRLALAVVLALHVGVSMTSEEPYRAFVADRTTRVGSAVGAWFRQALAPGDWMAVNTVGSLPYASGLPTLDMLGLTDAEIARAPVYVTTASWAGHRRGSGAAVLARRPRAVLWYNSAGLAEPHYLGDRQLADDPVFRFFYRIRREHLPAPDPPGVLARFAGTPFGGSREAAATAPSLGVRFAVEGEGWGASTIAWPGPILLVWFERVTADPELWQLATDAAGDVDRLVDGVAARWRRAAVEAPAADEEVRRRVEALCRQALERMRAGDPASAKQLLSEAARANGAARSPLVPRYIANVAVLEGELFTAVQAQREALRLDPFDPLNTANLKHLLRQPWRVFGSH